MRSNWAMLSLILYSNALQIIYVDVLLSGILAHTGIGLVTFLSRWCAAAMIAAGTACMYRYFLGDE